MNIIVSCPFQCQKATSSSHQIMQLILLFNNNKRRTLVKFATVLSLRHGHARISKYTHFLLS